MEHVFIVNPTAGKGQRVTQTETLAKELAKRHHLNVTIHRTTSAQHTTDLVRQIASLGSPVRFYACGGDGTLHYVVQGMVGYENAEVTCIPAGTGNDFLRNFGADSVKFTDPENLWDGDRLDLDLLQCNGRYCLSIACFGVDARVGRDVHKFSKFPGLSGKGGYLISSAYNGLQPLARRWTLTVDDQVIDGKFAVVSVCNGRHYGGGFCPIPQARLDDGQMKAITVGHINVFQFLKLFPHYCAGRHQAIAKYIQLYSPQMVTLSSQKQDITLCIDGEAEEVTQASVQIAPVKLRFFAPKGANPNASGAEGAFVATRS